MEFDYKGNPRVPYLILLGGVTLLTLLGIVVVFSASSIQSIFYETNPYTSLIVQTGMATLSLILILLEIKFYPQIFYSTKKTKIQNNLYNPPRKAKMFISSIYIFCVLSLIAVQIFGKSVNGNKNWLPVAFGIRIQPGEFSKLFLALTIGYLLGSVKSPIKSFKPLIIPLGLTGLVLGGILLGKDMGTAVIVALILIISLIIAGASKKIMLTILAVAGIASLFFIRSEEYRWNRVTGFLTNYEFSDEALRYQIMHAKYAFASGGLFGKGLGGSYEKWGYLPESENDFIFAVIGEELGFVGCVVIILLFLAITYAMYRITQMTPRRFEKIMIWAIMTFISGQAFMNILVTLASAPVMGVPLPFISAGGSSLLTSLTAVGIVIAIARNSPALKPKLKNQSQSDRRRQQIAKAQLK